MAGFLFFGHFAEGGTMFDKLRRAIGMLEMVILIFSCVIVSLISFIGGKIEMRR